MVSNLIDFIIIIGGLVLLINQMKIQKKMKNLISIMSDLQPAILEFSKAVDQSEASINNLKSVSDTIKNHKEVSKTSSEEEIFAMQNNNKAIIQTQRKSHTNQGKDDMVKNFFKITKGENQ